MGDKNNKAGKVEASLVYKLGNVSWDAIYRLTTNGQTEGELVVRELFLITQVRIILMLILI